MKKVLLLTVLALLSQLFCGNAFGQKNDIKGNPINFFVPDINGLILTKGNHGDVVMHFPYLNLANDKWNRIVASCNISIGAGSRGWMNDDSQMFLHTNGNIGIGGITNPSEKLEVSGNILASEYKLGTGGGLYKDPRGFVGLYANTLATLDFYLRTNEKPSLTMLKPKTGSQYPILAIYPKGRIVASGENNADLEFAGGMRGIDNGDTPPDMVIKANGNIGIGTTTPSDKFTVNGNLKLDNGKIMIGNKGELRINSSNEMETYGDSLRFNVNGLGGLQMKKGANGDFTLYFPNSDNNNTKWNRIVAKNQLSFNTGNRGLKNGENVSDLFIDYNGNVNIRKELTVAGNVRLRNNSKLYINVDSVVINDTLRNENTVFVGGSILSEGYSMGPKDSWSDYVFESDYSLKTLNDVEVFIQTNKHLPDIPSASEVKQNGYNLHDMNVKLLQKVEELTLYSIEQKKEIEQLKKVVSSYETLLEKVNQLESKINP
jgi:hypothetical protein